MMMSVKHLVRLAIAGATLPVCLGCASAPRATPEAVPAEGPTSRVRVVSLDAANASGLFGPAHNLRVSIFDSDECDGERSLAAMNAGRMLGRDARNLGMPGKAYSKRSASEVRIPADWDVFLIFAGFHSVRTLGSRHVTDIGFCSVPVSVSLDATLDYEMGYARGTKGRCTVTISRLAANGSPTKLRTIENAVTPFSKDCRALLTKRPGLDGDLRPVRRPVEWLTWPSGTRP